MTQRQRGKAAQSAAVQAQEKRRARLARAQRAADVRAVMAEPAGRRFVWGEVQRAGVFVTSFTGNSATFFNEGARAQGLKLMAEVKTAAPDLYLQMFTEAVADERAVAAMRAEAEALADDEDDTDGN